MEREREEGGGGGGGGAATFGAKWSPRSDIYSLGLVLVSCCLRHGIWVGRHMEWPSINLQDLDLPYPLFVSSPYFEIFG